MPSWGWSKYQEQDWTPLVYTVHNLQNACLRMLWQSVTLMCPQIGSPDLVILLACSNQQLRQRLEKRASQQGRPDDNTHAIEKRLDTFKHNITLIAKYYQERGLIVRVRCCSLLIVMLTVEFIWWFLWMITGAG